jgi:isopentenyl diphosphate isomerase/L-lactate dehydrogenase-like FMN-dependent dehydrogenase
MGCPHSPGRGCAGRARTRRGRGIARAAYAYGLALDGRDGVAAVCENVLVDLDLTLGLTGWRSLAEVDESLLNRQNR